MRNWLLGKLRLGLRKAAAGVVFLAAFGELIKRVSDLHVLLLFLTTA